MVSAPKQSEPVGRSDEQRYEDLRRSERTMVILRTVAIPWGLVHILAYRTSSYPPGVLAALLSLLALLGLANLAVMAADRRVRTLEQARRLALASFGFDVLVASGVVWLYAFDPGSPLWALLFILPLEGAIRFQLAGALGAWAALTVLYAAREVWGSGRYDYPLEWTNISFRMGIGFLIALVAGLMARDLVTERARLAEALEKLRRVDDLRAGLVSTLAHDVRNPLQVIRGTIRALLDYGGALDAKKAQDLLHTSDLQSERLERLSTDLLDLARLEQGHLQLNLERLALKDAVKKALSYVDHDGQMEIRIGDDVRVQADPHRLEQIVVNLADNALRYGEPPRVIEAARTNGHVRLRFEDQGPGVPEGDREHLFDAFWRRQDRGSVGLGLMIVKALAEAHGGGVSFEPNEPRGACFQVTLPAAR